MKSWKVYTLFTMSSGDLYAAVRNVILEDNRTDFNKFLLCLEEDYCGAAKIFSKELLILLFNNETALSRDFSAEIYFPLKDQGGRSGEKGRMCTVWLCKYQKYKQLFIKLLSQMSGVTQPIENIKDAKVKKEIMENRKI